MQVHLKDAMVLHVCSTLKYSLLSPEDTGQGWIFAASAPEKSGQAFRASMYFLKVISAA